MKDDCHVSNNRVTSFNPSGYREPLDVDEVVIQLREAYVVAHHIKLSDRVIVVKIYLCYLLHAVNVNIKSVTELQVLIYHLSRRFLDVYGPPSRITVGQSKKLAIEQSRNSGDPSSLLDCRQKTRKYTYKNNMAKQLLCINKGPASTLFLNPEYEKMYIRNIEMYSIRSDRAFVVAVHSIIDKLLAVIDARTQSTPRCGLIDKLIACFLRSKSKDIDKKFSIIARYHQKGLFVQDCKKVYLREMAKNDSTNENV